MKILSRRSFIFYILAAIFFAPGIAALYLYQHPQLLGGSINKGELITPPKLVKALVQRNSALNKWHLLLWSPIGCDKSCIQPLEKINRIRLALGRLYFKVDEGLLMSPYSKPMTSPLLESLQTLNISMHSLSQSQASKIFAYTGEPRIFIANPEGFLVLSYTINAPSDDIYHDIKLLLNTSQVKS